MFSNTDKKKVVIILGREFNLTRKELLGLHNPTCLQSNKVKYAMEEVLSDEEQKVKEQFTNDVNLALANW